MLKNITLEASATPIEKGYTIDISPERFTIKRVLIKNQIPFGGAVMTSVQTKLFKSNRSQAVRLSKDVAFPESVKEVEITAIGSKRINRSSGPVVG